jgi:hypothetical protein
MITFSAALVRRRGSTGTGILQTSLSATCVLVLSRCQPHFMRLSNGRARTERTYQKSYGIGNGPFHALFIPENNWRSAGSRSPVPILWNHSPSTCYHQTEVNVYPSCDLTLVSHDSNQVRVFQPPSMSGHTQTIGGRTEDFPNMRTFIEVLKNINVPTDVLKGLTVETATTTTKNFPSFASISSNA